MRRKGSKVGYIWTVDNFRYFYQGRLLTSLGVNMEWVFKENNVTVIALHKCGKTDSQIFKLLKPLKISRNFIYRAIKLYKDLRSVEDRVR
jgi:hypothetical protein